ncbi:hypothetical protein ElyMa_003114500 [Elysia marginata]|uniref:Uncharacterized protein n=1 Tax=Elysia marginata TaxID=1093978 RepID=A0AAV4IQE7_9GAST|nr:hypothetical protein ElyMa_003114500 [Elysia marginata]
MQVRQDRASGKPTRTTPGPSCYCKANKKRKCLLFETELQIIDEDAIGNKSKANICMEYSFDSSRTYTIQQMAVSSKNLTTIDSYLCA